jgi:hypothetical protein
LRLAILSALADSFGHAGASSGGRPALRRFAGKTVLVHQIDCAALLGCERVICLAGVLGPDIGAARTYAERAGLRFDVVESVVRLAASITADDDVVLFADGVLPDRAALVEALGGRSAVLAFPAEPALALGFERLDAERAWSGALRMRGAEVARLADLPPDCDLASTLLRIALQSGVRIIELGAAPLTDGAWQRRVQRHAVLEAERQWIARQVQPAPFTAPGLALTDRMALRWSRDAGGGRWARAPHLTAALAAVLALGAVTATWATVGLAFVFVMSVALAAAEVFDRVETLGAPPRKPGVLLPVASFFRDGLLIALLTLLIAAEPAWLRVAVPLILVGLLRLGTAIARPALRPLYADRIALLAVVLPVATQGWTAAATAAFSVLALADLLWTTRSRRTQLTAD